MSWRSVVISKCCKLDLRLDFMCVRTFDGETYNIHTSEIKLIVIETNQVSITVALISRLSSLRIPIIFCDEKHLPISSLQPYYGCHDCVKKISQQFTWSDENKALIWQWIVKEKIKNQTKILEHFTDNDEALSLLTSYIEEVKLYDNTNREGHAAKVYFNALFGKEFTRENDDVINNCLNYGYQIILAVFAREIKICGYLTEIGIFHCNQHNFYNLASDLMEPFRPIVDELVKKKDFKDFGHNEKIEIASLLNKEVVIDTKYQYLTNAIAIYTKSIFNALNSGDIKEIKNYYYEF